MSFSKYLQSRKPVILKQKVTTLFGTTETRDLVIPPLNTDIRFGNVLPTMTVSPLVFGATGTELRENFSWAAQDMTQDDEEMLFKKARIHPVFDQQACGSCWAVAFATTMSDCLVVSGAVSWPPYISPTFCMACYPQRKCRGGQPAQLALDVQRNGVADITCIDYSWCENDPKCNIRDSAQHFHVGDQSSKIPNCGCYFGNDKYIYKVNPGTDTFSVTDDNAVETYREAVKTHIVNYGSIIGGYLVLKNFMNGAFTRGNGGVYFDRADYDNIAPDGTIRFSDNIKSSMNSQGLHAVSIVGWGVAENIQYDNGQVGDVPYWHCRNSWGEGWGDNGYFKMAMYPFNRTAQFDKTVIVSVQGSNARIGGVILIRATNPPEIKSMREIQNRYKRAITKLEPSEFYNVNAEGEEGIGKEIKDFKRTSGGGINALVGLGGLFNDTQTLITVIVIIIAAVVVIIIMK